MSKTQIDRVTIEWRTEPTEEPGVGPCWYATIPTLRGPVVVWLSDDEHEANLLALHRSAWERVTVRPYPKAA